MQAFGNPGDGGSTLKPAKTPTTPTPTLPPELTLNPDPHSKHSAWPRVKVRKKAYEKGFQNHPDPTHPTPLTRTQMGPEFRGGTGGEGQR